MTIEPVLTELICFVCQYKKVYTEVQYPSIYGMYFDATPLNPLPKMVSIPHNADAKKETLFHLIKCHNCNASTHNWCTPEGAISEWTQLERLYKHTQNVSNPTNPDEKPESYILKEKVESVRITQLCRICKSPMIFERTQHYEWGNDVTYIHRCSGDESHKRHEFAKIYPCVEYTSIPSS